MSRTMLFYFSNILLVSYLISALISIFAKKRNSRLLFGAISGLLFGLAMGIILFWLPFDAHPSTIRKLIYTLLFMVLSISPALLSWKWRLDEKIQANFFKKKKSQ